MDFSTILSHPDCQEIISKLVTGVSPKEISQWLKIKYSDKDQKHLHLSSKLLQDYLDSHVDIATQFKKDQAIVSQPPSKEKKLTAALLSNKSYQERLIEYADKQVDVKRLVQELVFMIRDRIEQVFDAIQQNPVSSKGDYPLIKWFELLMNALEKCDKIVNQAPDQIIQHNVTIQQIDQHVFVIQEALRRTLSQIDHEAALLFIDIMNKEMAKLKPQQITDETVDKKIEEIKLLTDKVNKPEE